MLDLPEDRVGLRVGNDCIRSNLYRTVDSEHQEETAHGMARASCGYSPTESTSSSQSPTAAASASCCTDCTCSRYTSRAAAAAAAHRKASADSEDKESKKSSPSLLGDLVARHSGNARGS